MTPKQQEVRKQWVEALRSGKYEKCVGRLKYYGMSTRYCCLGVLCELAAKENIVTAGLNSFDGQINYLPLAVQNWVGLRTNDGLPNGIDVDDEALAKLNDNGRTFLALADIIESDDRYFV